MCEINEPGHSWLRFASNTQKRITLHSLYYRIWMPSSQAVLDFGNLIAGVPTIRTLTVENVSAHELRLDVGTSAPHGVQVLMRATGPVDPATARVALVASTTPRQRTTEASPQSASHRTGATREYVGASCGAHHSRTIS